MVLCANHQAITELVTNATLYTNVPATEIVFGFIATNFIINCCTLATAAQLSFGAQQHCAITTGAQEKTALIVAKVVNSIHRKLKIVEAGIVFNAANFFVTTFHGKEKAWLDRQVVTDTEANVNTTTETSVCSSATGFITYTRSSRGRNVVTVVGQANARFGDNTDLSVCAQGKSRHSCCKEKGFHNQIKRFV